MLLRTRTSPLRQSSSPGQSEVSTDENHNDYVSTLRTQANVLLDDLVRQSRLRIHA
jgi:hypothetical protein